jgi:hypothetical protein
MFIQFAQSIELYITNEEQQGIHRAMMQYKNHLAYILAISRLHDCFYKLCLSMFITLQMKTEKKFYVLIKMVSQSKLI